MRRLWHGSVVALSIVLAGAERVTTRCAKTTKLTRGQNFQTSFRCAESR